MNRYILLSEKEWHKELFKNLKEKIINDEWFLIDSKSDFNIDNVAKINPRKIFIPHWSYIITGSIYNKFECIVFHMTDLPYGRGGSPLQNLIIRGHKETKISAIKVEVGIDTGDIYLKKNLSLEGTAKKILLSANRIINEMITEIIQNDLIPIPQTGEVVEFKRRKPEDGNILLLNDINLIYDYIRMLDCEGYPNAFIETDTIKIEFSNANVESNNNITAHVRIFKK
jgi:methionyl-tRNA formyltransferase